MGTEKGISLLRIPGKVQDKTLTARMQKITKDKVSEGQGMPGVKQSRMCVHQIFNMKIIIRKRLLRRGRCAVFMDLEKSYDKVGWEVMGDVLMV